jgi:hypothetical protein
MPLNCKICTSGATTRDVIHMNIKWRHHDVTEKVSDECTKYLKYLERRTNSKQAWTVMLAAQHIRDGNMTSSQLGRHWRLGVTAYGRIPAVEIQLRRPIVPAGRETVRSKHS